MITINGVDMATKEQLEELEERVTDQGNRLILAEERVGDNKVLSRDIIKTITALDNDIKELQSTPKKPKRWEDYKDKDDYVPPWRSFEEKAENVYYTHKAFCTNYDEWAQARINILHPSLVEVKYNNSDFNNTSTGWKDYHWNDFFEQFLLYEPIDKK